MNEPTFHYLHQGVMGTMIDVRVGADDEATADAADHGAAAEMRRLERVFSAFDPDSVLSQWRRGITVEHPEFGDVMAIARRWQIASGGGFNPLVGVLSERWAEAERSGEVPTPTEMAELAASIATPRFDVNDGIVSPTGDCSRLNLNALAKGYIVDRAAAAAMAAGAVSVLVNAGGDLVHWGAGSVRAGIENPRRPYDNEPPLAVVDISNQALATSGLARRGFRVGDQWLGHVIDPVSGWPVESVLSISVLASDAMTADVLATVAGVRSPTAAVAFLNDIDGVEGFVVAHDGEHHVTAGWSDLSST